MNFQTFFLVRPAFIGIRLLGFGIFAHHIHEAPISERQAKELWLIPVAPNWRAAFVAPWL